MYKLVIPTFGHAAMGILYPTILTDCQKSDEMVRVEEAIEVLYTKVEEIGGSIRCRHTAGLKKVPCMELWVDQQKQTLMQQIKTAFDPNHILNPAILSPTDKRQ